MTRKFVKIALFSGALMAPAAEVAQAQMAKKGTTPYVTHFIFRPVLSVDVPGLDRGRGVACIDE